MFFFFLALETFVKHVLVLIVIVIKRSKNSPSTLPPLCPAANLKPSLEMENEEKIRLEARRRLEEQLKQYRVQRHKERVSVLDHLTLLMKMLHRFGVVSQFDSTLSRS